jgi:hypothetical protein
MHLLCAYKILYRISRIFLRRETYTKKLAWLRINAREKRMREK